MRNRKYGITSSDGIGCRIHLIRRSATRYQIMYALKLATASPLLLAREALI
jgi:hypothetical protein